jgi:hypothetical protein
MITMATLANALKTYYLPAVIEQMNYKVNAFYAAIDSGSEEVFGSAIKMAMKYGRNGGVGARDETGSVPTASSRKMLQVDYTTKNIYANIQVTDKMIKVGNGNNKGSFVNVLNSLIEDCLNDAKDYYGKMLFGDGIGSIGICTSEGPVTTMTLNATPGVMYLQEGMIIDIMATNNSVKYSALEITAVDTSAGTITTATTVTTLTTDYIVVSGSYNLELTGLKAIFASSGTIYGKSKTDYPFLVPNLITSVGELDELDLQKGIDDADARGGSDIDFMFCGNGVKRAYQYLMNAIRHNHEVMTLAGGYKVLTYNGIPLVSDKYCPAGEMYQMDKKDFKLHQIGEWDWLDKDGAVLSRVSGKAAYEATLVKYGDLGCRKPSGQTKLSGITEH